MTESTRQPGVVQQAEYIANAIRTENSPEITYSKRRVLAVLTAHIATGTLVDLMKKHIIYGKPVDELKRRAALYNLHRSMELLSNSDQGPERLTVNDRVFHAVIGMATETTEMVEALVKAIQGHPIDYVNVAEELGDYSWYEAILLDEVKVEKQDILDRNIAKLKARYGDKFSSEKAINRDLATERAILETQTFGVADGALAQNASETPAEEPKAA